MSDPASPRDVPVTGTLDRAALADCLYEAGWSRRDAAAAVRDVFDALSGALVAGEHVLVHRFGRFDVRERGARPGRDLRTGEVLAVAPHRTVTFRASPALRDALTSALGER